MAQLKIYKPFIEWKQGDEQFLYKDEEGNKYIIVKLVIGEITENYQVIDYIIEDIYKNVLDTIMKNKYKYKVDVKINQIPQLIITCDGYLLLHNPKIKKLHDDVYECLSKLEPKDIMDAYYELRLNMNALGKLGPATEYLLVQIRRYTGENISSSFARELIHKYIENTFFSVEEDDIKTYIRTLDYEDLLYYMKQILYHKFDIPMEDEYLTSLPQNLFKNVESIIKDELLLRFVKGDLKKR